MEHYHLIKKIGQGSYGEVWLAKHRKDWKQYVLKQINLQNASRRELRAAHLEVQLLASLKHPNIVSYRDAFETEKGYLIIAMGYCEGGDLYSKIREQKGECFEESQIVEWFIQICMALQYLHERNILHRDLKTQNIFLTKSRVIKVGDLGIAKVLDNESAMATTLIGTPYYMSPELFSNRPYNYKSDVWALGCCIYEIATLKHAFNARDINSLMYKILRGKLPAMPKQYSSDLLDLIRLMLHHNPDKRPSVARILRSPYIKKNIAVFLEGTKLRQRSPSSSKLVKLKQIPQIERHCLINPWIQRPYSCVVSKESTKNAESNVMSPRHNRVKSAQVKDKNDNFSQLCLEGQSVKLHDFREVPQLLNIQENSNEENVTVSKEKKINASADTNIDRIFVTRKEITKCQKSPKNKLNVNSVASGGNSIPGNEKECNVPVVNLIVDGQEIKLEDRNLEQVQKENISSRYDHQKENQNTDSGVEIQSSEIEEFDLHSIHNANKPTDLPNAFVNNSESLVSQINTIKEMGNNDKTTPSQIINRDIHHQKSQFHEKRAFVNNLPKNEQYRSDSSEINPVPIGNCSQNCNICVNKASDVCSKHPKDKISREASRIRRRLNLQNYYSTKNTSSSQIPSKTIASISNHSFVEKTNSEHPSLADAKTKEESKKENGNLQIAENCVKKSKPLPHSPLPSNPPTIKRPIPAVQRSRSSSTSSGVDISTSSSVSSSKEEFSDSNISKKNNRNSSARQRRRAKLQQKEIIDAETESPQSFEVYHSDITPFPAIQEQVNSSALPTDIKSKTSLKKLPDLDTTDGSEEEVYDTKAKRCNKDFNMLLTLLDNTLKEESQEPLKDCDFLSDQTEQKITNNPADSGKMSDTIRRLRLRAASLRKDCLQALGSDILNSALRILDNIDNVELEANLKKILGDDKFNDYAGKIWQLKFCEESIYH